MEGHCSTGQSPQWAVVQMEKEEEEEDEEEEGVAYRAVHLQEHGSSVICITQQREHEIEGDKPVPVSLLLPQKPHGLSWDRTRSSALTVRRLTGTAVVISKEKHDARQIRMHATVSVPPNKSVDI